MTVSSQSRDVALSPRYRHSLPVVGASGHYRFTFSSLAISCMQDFR